MLVIIFIFIQVKVDLLLPEYVSKIVDEGVINSDTAYIINMGIRMILLAFLGMLALIIGNYFAALVACAFAKDLRTAVYEKIEKFSLNEMNKFGVSSLITRTTNDITQMQNFLFMFLSMIIMAPILGVGAISQVLKTNASMLWIISICLAATLVLIITLFVIAVPKFKKIQKLIDKLNLVSREHLTGLKVIKAFSNEDYQEEKFDKSNKSLTKIQVFVDRLMGMLDPALSLIMNISAILIIWFGSHFIESGTLQIGEMMAFMQYAMQMMIAFVMITMVFVMWPRASVSAKRIAEVLTERLDIKDGKDILNTKTCLGKISFCDVSFRYRDADKYVLQNISFDAEPGTTTAFIGSTGSGKSTLINLIPRFYDATDGKILIDGKDIKNLSLKSLRSIMGYVPQKGILFSGTIKENISFGKRLSDKQLKEVAKISQSIDFITKKDNKFAARVAQKGSNFSGGQKQRLSIARALAKDPKILIFDDSFSALDFKTDAKLRNALNNTTKSKTILIVAQRINTIKNANQIIVLDQGKIAGIGTHNELIKTCAIYKEIVLSQLGEEGLK
ncbi:MAG TPA: ABC transporter ATP-binding protein [Bacilli bacterium]|nr:ABC transporter ATP-binding protein [Bacilli bacterium]